MIINNQRIIYLLALLSISLCVSSYNFTFSTTDTSNYILKRYPIGLVQIDSVVAATINVPNSNNPLIDKNGKRFIHAKIIETGADKFNAVSLTIANQAANQANIAKSDADTAKFSADKTVTSSSDLAGSAATVGNDGLIAASNKLSIVTTASQSASLNAVNSVVDAINAVQNVISTLTVAVFNPQAAASIEAATIAINAALDVTNIAINVAISANDAASMTATAAADALTAANIAFTIGNSNGGQTVAKINAEKAVADANQLSINAGKVLTDLNDLYVKVNYLFTSNSIKNDVSCTNVCTFTFSNLRVVSYDIVVFFYKSLATASLEPSNSIYFQLQASILRNQTSGSLNQNSVLVFSIVDIVRNYGAKVLYFSQDYPLRFTLSPADSYILHLVPLG